MSLTLESLAGMAAARCKIASGIKAAPADQIAVHLPYLNLTIHCMSDEFQDLCTKALVSAAASSEDASSLRIVIGNQDTAPELALPQWAETVKSLVDLNEALELSDLNGMYDAPYKSWQVMSPSEGQAFYYLDRADAFAPWERAFPLRNFLHWAYAAQNRRLLHAATLGMKGSGVMLAGAGGAGKSGTTLSGILHGLQSCGDDYVGIEMVAGKPRAFSVMRLMKQDPKGLQRLGLDPSDARFGPVNWQNKHEFDFDTLVPGSRASSLSIKAILLPHIGNGKTSKIRPASTKDALFALMPNNLQQLPGCMKQGFTITSQLTKTVPAYHLELSQDPQEISSVITAFLTEEQA